MVLSMQKDLQRGETGAMEFLQEASVGGGGSVTEAAAMLLHGRTPESREDLVTPKPQCGPGGVALHPFKMVRHSNTTMSDS